mgnify:CR=1 FL=1
MRRDLFNGLDLEKEVIDEILAENGRDIEKAKKDYETIKWQTIRLKNVMLSWKN